MIHLKNLENPILEMLLKKQKLLNISNTRKRNQITKINFLHS